MQIARTLLIAGTLLSGGCSAIIATSGLNLDPLHNRDDVRRQFGSPSESGSELSHEYDEYRTHRKIADRMTVNGMAFVMTLGLSEFVGFPYEMYRLGRSTVLGQTVRFSYDELGNVRDVHIDGERLWWMLEPPAPYTTIGEGDEAEPKDEAA